MIVFYSRNNITAPTLGAALEQSPCIVTVDDRTGNLRIRIRATVQDGATSISQDYDVPLDGYELVFKKSNIYVGRKR